MTAVMSNVRKPAAKPQDRRIRKTTAALKSSLARLMQTKKVRDISVKELTDMADINRGTFYLHYRDVFDLLEQSEEELLSEFRDVLNRFTPEKGNVNTSQLFENAYMLVQENADLVGILLGSNGDINFLNKLKLLVREKCLHDWVILLRQQDIRFFDAYYSFIVGGCVNLVQYWLANGMKESPAELAEITQEILLKGLQVDG